MPLSQRTIHIPYGLRTLDIEMGPIARRAFEEAHPKLMAGHSHPTTMLDRSLTEPIASLPLQDLLARSRRVLLVTSDSTRTVAYHSWLLHLIAFVQKHLPEGGRVKVVVGGGTHTPMHPRAARQYLGIDEEPLCHDSTDESMLTAIGRTSRGTEITVNREATDADLIIATGAVTFHYFAGFTGGPKAVFPGLGGLNSVLANHSLSVDAATGSLNSAASVGRLAGNPVYEDCLEAAAMMPTVFLVNVVLGPDGRAAAFFCGQLQAAHAEAARFVSERFVYEMKEPADLLLLSCGGHPRDMSLYQAHKALKLAEAGVAPGGTIYFLAMCNRGMGHPGFDYWTAFDLAGTKDQLRKGYQPIGHLALSLRQLAAKFKIKVYSKLPWHWLRRWNLEPIRRDHLVRALRGTPVIARHPVYDPHGSILLLRAAEAVSEPRGGEVA